MSAWCRIVVAAPMLALTCVCLQAASDDFVNDGPAGPDGARARKWCGVPSTAFAGHCGPVPPQAFLNKTIVCLGLRSKVLSGTDEVDGPSVEAMKRVLPGAVPPARPCGVSRPTLCASIRCLCVLLPIVRTRERPVPLSVTAVLKTLFDDETPVFPIDLREFGSAAIDMSESRVRVELLPTRL